MGNYVTGDSGSFTFTGAEGIVVADFGVWQGNFDRKVYPTTPFLYQTGRVTLGRLDARGQILQWVDGVAPPFPANGSVSGQMTLNINGSLGYTFKARLYNLGMTSNSNNGDPVAPQYQFISSTGAITGTPSALQFNATGNSMLIPLM